MQGSERTGKLRKALAFAGRLTSILLLTTFLVLSDDQRAAIAQAIADPMAVIEGRSPGARDNAKLRQSKQRARISPISEELLDRDFVISPEAFDPESDIFTENAESPFVPAPTEPAPGGRGEQAFTDTPANPFAYGQGGGGGGSVVGTSGGGGGGGSDGGPKGDGGNCDGEACGVPTGGTDTPTIIPVPEPSTWLLVIAGFMTLGGTLRIVRRAKAGTSGEHKQAA